jgi:branched-chain amino acid transport system substrate-binding protein
MKKTINYMFTFCCILFFAACNNQKNDGILHIGASLDFTGTNAGYGKQVKEGIDLAVDYINDSINKGIIKIDVKYLDSGDIDREAISNVNKFISLDKIYFIIGGISSNVVKSMITPIERNNAFLFAPASSGSILTNVSKNFSRNWPSDDLEAGYAAKYAIENLNSNKAIVVYVNSYYGIGLKNRFVKSFIESNRLILDTINYSVDQTDFTIIIGKIKSKKPDCIYLAGNPKEMGRFMKQLKEQNLNFNIISNTGFLQPDCLEPALGAANGVIIPTPKPSESGTQLKSVQIFQNLYISKYNRTPTLVTANAFDAVLLIYGAVNKHGFDVQKVAAEIRNKKNFESASGLANFSDGEIQTEITFMRIENNKAIEISE